MKLLQQSLAVTRSSEHDWLKIQIKYAHIRKKIVAEFVAIIFFTFIIPREDGFVHTLAVFHRYLSS